MAYSHYVKAQILSRNQHVEQALRELRIAILLDPHAPELRARQVELYAATRDWERMREALALLRTEYTCTAEESRFAQELLGCLEALEVEAFSREGERTCSNSTAEATPIPRGSGG